QGSVSGFTTVHIPVTLTLHSPSGTKHINTTASLSATVSSSTHPAASAAPGPTPIITGRPQPAAEGDTVRCGFSRRLSDDLQFDQFSSPVPPSRPLKEEDQSGPPPEPPQGKLVILVEDFYYGSAPGQSSDIPNLLSMKFSGPYRCIHCAEMLRNNIKLMNHMLQHVPTMDSQTSCPHCFRHFTSPLRLQGHLEAVHSQYESTVTCRICELAFRNEPAFLWHMKTTHKPGEMPYVCQVCDFRSSFYSDVWSHFQQAHADTRHLMCQYCLRVLRSNACYQKHFARHQKKHVLGCDKCRLRFLYVKERVEHKVLHHKTHVRPPQLSGLKPGTKVHLTCPPLTCPPLTYITSLPPAQTAPKRKTVESLGPLLVSRPLQHCMECLNLVPDLRTHFPSLVRCSLCRFITCCSTSYANHMIKYVCTQTNLLCVCFRLSETLKCDSCTLSTCRGDVMAKHLTERPEHTCITPTHTGSAHTGGQLINFSAAMLLLNIKMTRLNLYMIVKSLYPGVPPTTCEGETLLMHFNPDIGGDDDDGYNDGVVLPPQPSVPSLSVPQLCTILTALCHGVPQASIRYQVSPPTIQSWIMQQLRLLDLKEWAWKTDSMAEWVLGRREQQLIVAEDVLLLAAKRTLGEDSLLLDCYTWIVDFMLRHDLGLQTCNNNRLRSISDNSRAFVQALCSKVNIQNRDLPSRCFGCMDELPVFIDLDQFSKQNLAAFQLFKSPEEKPAFDIVLSALSDGSFLRPLLFFQGTVSPLPEGFPDNVLLEARQEGFTEQDRLQIWVDKVWRPHATAQLDHESLLMVDIHRGHVTTEFRDALTSTSTDVVFIPLGCCARLQPLDVCVVPVVRDFLQVLLPVPVYQSALSHLYYLFYISLRFCVSYVSQVSPPSPASHLTHLSQMSNLSHLCYLSHPSCVSHLLHLSYFPQVLPHSPVQPLPPDPLV
uniref:C2H2-type domain-containing protein n=1 Tax=Amphiprion percula TaxID=161767 RepID=A0A3P8SVG9_AMPPE